MRILLQLRLGAEPGIDLSSYVICLISTQSLLSNKEQFWSWELYVTRAAYLHCEQRHMIALVRWSSQEILKNLKKTKNTHSKKYIFKRVRIPLIRSFFKNELFRRYFRTFCLLFTKTFQWRLPNWMYELFFHKPFVDVGRVQQKLDPGVPFLTIILEFWTPNWSRLKFIAY